MYKHKSEDEGKENTYLPKPGEVFELPQASAAVKLIAVTNNNEG